MRRRFTLAVSIYLALCLVVAIAIVLRGDGPHPRIVALYPQNGERYWPGGLAQITFSQAMDTSSVISALQVSPGGEGQAAWYGNTLNFQPVGDWRPDTLYKVMLTGKVTDAEGRPFPTPFTLSFRVYHVHQLTMCKISGVPNVCDRWPGHQHALTHEPLPVTNYALSGDGTLLAYTRLDAQGVPHLFVIDIDGTGRRQLTSGQSLADSQPSWAPNDVNSITYLRKAVLSLRPLRLGAAQTWNINVDGTNNAQL